MDSEPRSAAVFIKALDRQYLKQNTSSVVLYLEQYVKLQIGESDNILKVINKLNYYSQLLTAAKYPHFVDRNLRGVLLLSHFPPS